tara:strand:+ start:215 stop:910 length:696 start_codon:yes stop_codon:yes gene_type:complete
LKKFEAIILLGGKGKRVSKFTKSRPKCLIKIYGKPFLYYQLKYLKKNNITNVILSTGYRSKDVRDYVKEIKFMNLKIVNDGNKLLGTGGAINKSINILKEKFYVIYGDSYLNFSIKLLKAKKKYSTMAIYKNTNKFDLSNVKKKSDYIIYNKSKKNRGYNYIDYGASYLDKSIFDKIKKNAKFDLATLLKKISKKKQLQGYVVKKRFYEIGSYNGITQFKKYIKNELYKNL